MVTCGAEPTAVHPAGRSETVSRADVRSALGVVKEVGPGGDGVAVETAEKAGVVTEREVEAYPVLAAELQLDSAMANIKDTVAGAAKSRHVYRLTARDATGLPLSIPVRARRARVTKPLPSARPCDVAI